MDSREHIACTNELLEVLGCKTVAELLKVESVVLFMRQFPEREGNYLPLNPFEAYANGAAKGIDFTYDGSG